MSEISAALLGAAIGGLTAGAGTVLATMLVTRLRDRRQLRIELYDTYIPALIHKLSLEEPEGAPEVAGRKWGDLTRLAILAGPRDARRWVQVDEAARAFALRSRGEPIYVPETNEVVDPPARETYRRAKGELISELGGYHDWLERRLRGRWRRTFNELR